MQLFEPQHPRTDLHVNKECRRFHLNLVRVRVLDGRLHVQLAALDTYDFCSQDAVGVLSDWLPVER